MVPRDDYERLIQLVNKHGCKVQYHDNHFSVRYGDDYNRAQLTNEHLALTTVNGEVRTIPLAQVCRLDVMLSGSTRLLYLVQKHFTIANTYRDYGQVEVTGVVLAPSPVTTIVTDLL